MAEDKQIKNLIINKLTKEQYKNIVTKSEDELYDVIDDEHYTSKEISELLNTKQDKLTAGTGIEILSDGTINNTLTSAEWGNITGTLSNQIDLQNTLNTKVNKEDGKSLISDTEIIRLSSVYNYNDTEVKNLINTKQDKLTAGTGIEILSDGTINNTLTSAEWGNITGDITTQEDLQDLLNDKVNKEDGKSLISDTEIIRLSSVYNYNDTEVKNLINTKQDKLTAGTGIEISDNNVISNIKSVSWGDIKGNISNQNDLADTLNNKASKLIYIDSVLSIQNSNNEILNSVNIKSANDIDKNTIKINDNSKLQVEGMFAKSGEYLYDWIGTEEEYNTAVLNGDIPEDENWVCWITDDIEESGAVSTKNATVDLDNLSEIGEARFTSKVNINLDNISEEGKTELQKIIIEKIPTATTEVAGVVKPDGTTITITEDGVISADIEIPEVNIATTDTAGIVKPDGSTITIADGVISAIAQSGGDEWEYSVGTNSYIKHKTSGLMVQGGSFTLPIMSYSTKTITFSKAFDTACVAVTLDGVPSSNNVCSLSSRSKTSFTLTANTIAEFTVCWIAFGY